MKRCSCGNVIKEYRPGTRMKYSECYKCRKKTAREFVTSMERISNTHVCKFYPTGEKVKEYDELSRCYIFNKEKCICGAIKWVEEK